MKFNENHQLRGVRGYSPNKMDRVLEHLGLTPAAVQRQAQRCAPLTPDQVARINAKMLPKGSCGRRGLPEHVVNAMYADYQRLGSTRKVGALYGRTGQSVQEMFRGRGLVLKKDSRALLSADRFHFDGRLFTPGKNGYLRATTGAREPLHHAIWTQANGPIPPGRVITFKDGNPRNFDLGNLACEVLMEVARIHIRRLRPDYVKLPAEVRRERNRKLSLAYYHRKAAENRARGLRVDGKPMKRHRNRTPEERAEHNRKECLKFYHQRKEKFEAQGLTARGTPRKIAKPRRRRQQKIFDECRYFPPVRPPRIEPKPAPVVEADLLSDKPLAEKWAEFRASLDVKAPEILSGLEREAA